MDIERLKKIAEKVGPIQIVFAGKAAPDDLQGKQNLRYVFEIKKALKDSKIKIVFLEGYNMPIAKKLVAGVDLWLNTPQIPLEASGTSGMKAAFNGIPSLSSLDGWWLEGHIENVTGWSIGKRGENTSSDYDESDELYSKLEQNILKTYYNNKPKWQEIMMSTIMVNGSMFNSHRMVKEYILDAYL
jgi:starch phosphorylase